MARSLEHRIRKLEACHVAQNGVAILLVEEGPDGSWSTQLDGRRYSSDVGEEVYAFAERVRRAVTAGRRRGAATVIPVVGAEIHH